MRPIVFEASSSYIIRSRDGATYLHGQVVPAGASLQGAADRGRGEHWRQPLAEERVLVRRAPGSPEFCSVWALLPVERVQSDAAHGYFLGHDPFGSCVFAVEPKSEDPDHYQSGPGYCARAEIRSL